MPASAIVAHGGGPTPVINASLAGLIAEARRHAEIAALYGAEFGLNGLVEDRFYSLSGITPQALEAIRKAPGSVLGSSRRAVTPKDDERIFEVFRRRDVRYFFYTGGNGSMDTALRFHRHAHAIGYELNVIGIPKTIDNDIVETDHTPGYASCARFFAHAVRDIGADNRALPSPICLVEILGRNAGWVVAATAHARHEEGDPPHLIYFPEFGIAADKLCDEVMRVYHRFGRCVVAVCEGQTDEKGGWFGAELITARGAREQLPANMAQVLARLIWSRTGVRARAEKPGLLGRSCQALASEVDREESWRCGEAAVRAAIAGESGKMVAIRRVPGAIYQSEMTLVPLESVARIERKFPVAWMNEARNDVRPEFLDWSQPIIGPVEAHPRLADRIDPLPSA
jgi:ATP-dependent phosphofructokinase / diphosphate-dependent phosphofructokinase